jgi:type III secretion protein HrpB1
MNNKQQTRLLAPLMALLDLATKKGLLEEAAMLLPGIRASRPDMVELNMVEAHLAVMQGRYTDAIRLLRDVESSPTHWSHAKAMMAGCQFLIGDSEWERSVNDVLTNPDAAAEAQATANGIKSGEISPSPDNEPDQAGSGVDAFTFSSMDFGYAFLRA